ncbi:MAG: D-2-hydroxyacid dehydrogenase [Lagierella massiliensis]|nr:D-2-hydroxyacid dehydrogenase [Lagierella massiliensis]
MKIVVFNLRDDEKNLLEKWKKTHSDVEVDAYKESLKLDNVNLLKGADTVSLSTVSKIDNEVYYKLKDMGISLISQRSAGFDMYNLDKLNELSMTLINVPRYSPYAIAEYVVATAMYFTRNLNKIFKNVKKQDFSWDVSFLSKEMRTLTVGIVGTGNIGREAGKLFKGLGAKIIGYDMYPSKEAKEILDYVSLDELYERSDVISFHVPATKDNFHMINDEAIYKMKDSAVLINAARGSIMDTKAVLKALDENKLKGVALDVYENEFDLVKKDRSKEKLNDPIIEEIIKRDDIIYTPHIAFYTETALDNLLSFALDESINFLKTGNSNSIVNKR